MRSVIVVLVLSMVACGSKGANEPGGRGGQCTKGEYFVPGCSEEPGIVAGCYERCAGAVAVCGPGETCATVTVMPACAFTGEGACDSCTEDVAVCVPWGE